MIIPLPPDCSKRLFEDAPHLRERAWTSTHSNVIVVESPQMQQVISTARQLANTDATALIQGESGTGKEILAKAIHAWSHRAGQPFITIDCTTLPESLIESELFGHERGAFTGALTTKKGLFEEANRWTIFLDEVGELALSAQVKLLRVLQEQTFRRVGGTTPIHIDVRILAAPAHPGGDRESAYPRCPLGAWRQSDQGRGSIGHQPYDLMAQDEKVRNGVARLMLHH